jgi:hypothetical protein
VLVWEKEDEEETRLVGKKNGVKANFLANFTPNFIAPQYSKSTSIYKEWKRNILSLSGTNLGPSFKLEGSQLLV